jgi:hypothetical protein
MNIPITVASPGGAGKPVAQAVKEFKDGVLATRS